MPSLARALCARLLLVLASGAVGCRTAPIYEPTDVELGAPAGAKLAQVATAIREAAASLNWATTEQAPGVIRAELEQRCVIEIHFDARRFSIRHVRARTRLRR
jgi:hypothetical protein